MNYVFVFLGEFGYELFNWQGVIRKFSKLVSPEDKIICCSRARLHPLYEAASRYLEISGSGLFQQSVACGYFGLDPDDHSFQSRRYKRFDRRLRRELRSLVWRELGVPEPCASRFPWAGLLAKGRTFRAGGEDYRFVFSSDQVDLLGCRFGCAPKRYGASTDGDIYGSLDLGNNEFKKIEPDPSARPALEAKLGWSLDEPFVLAQTRTRDIVTRSRDSVPHQPLLEALSGRGKVVLLSFQTGRRSDSYSAFAEQPNCYLYRGRTFAEQACLVQAAARCVFFTEGDFGSHIYVPPFMGRNVFAIAPRSVYHVETTPIEFWNRNVFRFGGHILPRVSEEVFSSRDSIQRTADEILA